jgi:hypothetical protein
VPGNFSSLPEGELEEVVTGAGKAHRSGSVLFFVFVFSIYAV